MLALCNNEKKEKLYLCEAMDVSPFMYEFLQKVVKIIFHPNRNINLDFRGFLLSHDKVMAFSMRKDHTLQENKI